MTNEELEIEIARLKEFLQEFLQEEFDDNPIDMAMEVIEHLQDEILESR